MGWSGIYSALKTTPWWLFWTDLQEPLPHASPQVVYIFCEQSDGGSKAGGSDTDVLHRGDNYKVWGRSSDESWVQRWTHVILFKCTKNVLIRWWNVQKIFTSHLQTSRESSTLPLPTAQVCKLVLLGLQKVHFRGVLKLLNLSQW